MTYVRCKNVLQGTAGKFGESKAVVGVILALFAIGPYCILSGKGSDAFQIAQVMVSLPFLS